MTESVTTPPARSRSGCFAKGCLTFLFLALFLGVAFVGGGYWALRHLQSTYSATKPLSFGKVTSDDSSDDQHGMEQTAPTPEEQISPQVQQQQPIQRAAPVGSVREQWRAFEKAGRHGEPSRIELTANDINSLIADAPKLRGKAFVSVENNAARVRVSVPLDGMFMMEGRYLNGEATVEPSADGDPRKTRISNVVMGNQAVPESVLDRRLFGWSPIRGLMTGWLDEHSVTFLTIENDRVIGATAGSR